MMKRLIIPGIIASVLAVTVCVHAAASPDTKILPEAGSAAAGNMAAEDVFVEEAAVIKTSQAKAAGITENDAKRIALEHVGLSEKDVTFINAHKDYDDGRNLFDVEFYKGLEEYDFEIDATDGNILGFDYDIENYEIKPEPAVESSPQPPADTAIATTKQSSGNVTQEEAKQIALKKAGVSEKDTTFLHVGHEYDDGFSMYNVDFLVGTTEYEFDIDANSGAILEYDAESIYD